MFARLLHTDDHDVPQSLCSVPELIKLSYLPCAFLRRTPDPDFLNDCLCNSVLTYLIFIDNFPANVTLHESLSGLCTLQLILEAIVAQCMTKVI